MILKIFPSGPLDTNGYLLGCSETKRAVVIDVPPGSSGLLLEEAQQEGLLIEKILLTHAHWDHIAEVSVIKEKLQIPVWVHKEEAPHVENPGSARLPLPKAIQGTKVDGLLYEGQKIQVGNLELLVIHTPGHSPGGVCLYLEKQKVLISGDTLFCGTMGRVDLPGSQPAKMWESLKKLSTLPQGTRVYPGHGRDTTLANEKWIVDAESLYG